jgi:hypothetical protein
MSAVKHYTTIRPVNSETVYCLQLENILFICHPETLITKYNKLFIWGPEIWSPPYSESVDLGVSEKKCRNMLFVNKRNDITRKFRN